MINFISSWAEQVIICVVIVTILEMILPKGNIKKYIKTVIGIYVLYTIISPIIKLAGGSDINIDYSEYEKYMNTSEVSIDYTAPTVEDTYRSEIEKQMMSDLEDMGFETKNISFDFSIEGGNISNVSLTLTRMEKKTSKENVIAINKIEIGESKEENILSSSEVKEIKDMISSNYGVDYEKITINSK